MEIEHQDSSLAKGEVKSRHPDTEHIHIFVNRRKFDETLGVKSSMTVDEVARLVGQTDETAVVRRSHGSSGNVSEPLAGYVEVKSGDQFLVTRKTVEGGSGVTSRIEHELQSLRGSGQKVDYAPEGTGYVIYFDLPVTGQESTGASDVLVPVPQGYAGSMIDRAALPVDSPWIGRVRGQPQEEVTVAGRRWRLMSYHPHNGGGAPPWNPNQHGFHTYIDELLNWLGKI
jgi:hypothetical protein